MKAGSFLRVDNNLKEISYKEFDKSTPERNAYNYAYKNPNESDFYSYDGGIEFKDHFMDFVADAKGKRYRGFIRKPAELFQSYNKVWDHPVDGYPHYGIKTADGKFYTILTENNKERNEMLHCFSMVNGNSVFTVQLPVIGQDLQNITSTILIDTTDQSLIIAGGYFNPKMKSYEQTIEGYFVFKVSFEGKILYQYHKELETPEIPFAGRLDRKLLNIVSIQKNGNGDYQLLAENMFLNHHPGSGGEAGGSIYYDYGYTRWVFNNKLEPKSTLFFPTPRKYAVENIYDEFSQFAAYLSTATTNYERYNISYCIANSSDTKIIFRVVDGNKYFIIGDNITNAPEIDLGKGNAKQFFRKDENSYYLFEPQSGAYQFAIKKF
ncbi:MAG TPA: hypothetical protein VFF27_16680 [Bacteroidia bacterium]|nr:hypothetical protein [Bacteroidia bacterium]